MLLTLLSSALAAPSLSASYYGDALVHPGGSLGVDVPVLELRRRTLAAGGQVGFTVDPAHDTMLFTQGTLALRRDRFWKLRTELILGLGGSRSFHNALTYTADGSTVPLAGQWGVMPSVAVGIGRQTFFAEELRWHLRPTVYLLSPYNAGAAPEVAVQAGLTWTPGGER